MSLLDLPWFDVLVPSVLARVSLKDCYNLRCVSKDFRTLVEFNFQNLKVLKLIGKRDFPARSFRPLNVCEHIRVLNFSRCEFLTDELLIPLLRRNSNIENVNLSRCTNVTTKSLQPLILQCNIKVLKLAKCSWLTAGAIEALTLHQSSLEEVDISYSNLISDNCLILFLKKFTNIKILSLEGIPQVGDRCMFAVSKFSLNIRHLNIAHCQNISDLGISQLAGSCTNLESLFTYGCTNVTNRSLAFTESRNIVVDRRSFTPISSAFHNNRIFYFQNMFNL